MSTFDKSVTCKKALKKRKGQTRGKVKECFRVKKRPPREGTRTSNATARIVKLKFGAKKGDRKKRREKNCPTQRSINRRKNSTVVIHK